MADEQEARFVGERGGNKMFAPEDPKVAKSTPVGDSRAQMITGSEKRKMMAS
jgi:hypothetical protein